MPAVAQAPDQPIPMPPEGHGSLSYWKSQLQQAADKKKDRKEKEWDRNVQAYLGKTLQQQPLSDTVTVPKDFANVERKKAELFFQLPDVNLQPKMPGLEDAVHTFQAVINHKLGPEGVDAAALMMEVTFDACMTGLLCSKVGYESFAQGTVDVPTGEMQPGPQPPMPPGAVLGLNMPEPPLVPVTAPAPNIVFERYFWERISPANVLIPDEFSSFNYDKAPWLAYEFEEDWEVLKRRYKLADDLKPQVSRSSDGSNKLKSEEEQSGHTSKEKVKGTEVWYRAAIYDESVVHPELLRYFVILDGVEEPVRHVDSPYQELGSNGLKGMKGFPIHLGAVRYTSDTAYPAIETTIGRAQVEELQKSRTQMLLQRDRNVPMRMADVSRIGGEPGLDKLRRNVWQAVIPVTGLDANNPPIIEVQRSAYPPEDFQFNAIISRDLDEVWAFGPNQRGLETTERKTATEIKNIQSNVSSRLDYERRQIIRFFIGGVQKLGALIQKFADQQDYIQIVGPNGERSLEAWNKDTIQGEFVYDARPDSSVRVDAAQEFNDLIQMYNLTGRDPHANRTELLTKMARIKNIDPARFVIPQLQEKGPEPPRLSFAFKGDEVDPRNPNFPILLEILQQAGYKISPDAIAQAQGHAQAQGTIMNEALNGLGGVGSPTGQGKPPLAEHPGSAEPMEPLNKHQTERTGQLSGPKTH